MARYTASTQAHRTVLSPPQERSVIVLAAGRGTRMRSEHPKVLLPLGGRPLLYYAAGTAAALNPQSLYIVYGDEAVRELPGLPPGTRWVYQEQRQGTGHATLLALKDIPQTHQVLIINGDAPLLTAGTLGQLLSIHPRGGVAVLTACLANPTGYGRILRDTAGKLTAIIEHADATPEQLAINEVNAGVLVANAADLRNWLSDVGCDNRQGEYYLGDCIARALAADRELCTLNAADADEVRGINTRAELADLERILQRRRATELMNAGLSLMDPERFDLRGNLRFGKDVVIDVNVILEGEVRLGNGVHVGAGCVIRDSDIGDGTRVLPYSLIEDAITGNDCSLGPYCRIRPGTRLEANVRIGNFVELKQAEIGAGTRISHLSYVGDAEVGADANLGCGTVTCNYDGASKHRSVIEDRVHVGSHVQLVAPIRVGRDATVAAGSTLTEDVEPGTLAVARSRQQTVRGWRRPGSGGKA